MKMTKILAAAAFASLALAAPATFAQGTSPKMDMDKTVKMYDGNKDGMVSKAEAMKMIEKAFDKVDGKKAGMLDKTQFEIFLKMVMDASMGG